GERMAEPQVGAQRIVLVLVERPPRAEEIDAGRQRPVEEPGLREADLTLLGVGAGPDAQAELPAAAQEVVLGDVEGADEAVGRGVAAADREEAGRPLGD